VRNSGIELWPARETDKPLTDSATAPNANTHLQLVAELRERLLDVLDKLLVQHLLQPRRAHLPAVRNKVGEALRVRVRVSYRIFHYPLFISSK
jgi:hypothetical protein